MSDWLLALDFGTTASAAAVRVGDDGSARALVFPDGASTVSSSVYAEGRGQMLVGTEADNEAEFRLDSYEPTPKRRVGDDQVRLGDWEFTPAELIGAVLTPVIAEALRQHNNAAPGDVVLTHPVSWRATRRAVLADAVHIAASHNSITSPEPTFVPEPVAAARWYAHTDPPREGEFFAVYDLGGGTFDTAVLQATGAGFEVVASGGIDPLGGFDFDAALFTHLGENYIAAADSELWAQLSGSGPTDPDIARQRRRLQQRVTLLKTGLSTSTDKRIQLPGVEGPVVVTRSEFEYLIADHVDETVAELERTIADAGITANQLNAIYRIGGASRTPLVGAALDRLHVPVKILDQPKLVVAQGAATPSKSVLPVAASPTSTMPATRPIFKQSTTSAARPESSAAPKKARRVPPAQLPSFTPKTPSANETRPASHTPAQPAPRSKMSGPTIVGVTLGCAVAVLLGIFAIIAAVSPSNTPSASTTSTHRYAPTASDTTSTADYAAPAHVTQPQAISSAAPASSYPTPNVSGADVYGFIDYAGARCLANSHAILVGLTVKSAITICQTDSGATYYRGYGLNNQLSVQIDGVSRSGSGWTASNNGYLYTITPSELLITTGGNIIQEEMWIKYWSA